jgi:dienelactone hydrolase
MKLNSALLFSVSFCVLCMLPGRSAAGEADPADYRDHTRVMYYLDENKAEQPVKTAADWAIRRRHILSGMQLAMGNLPQRDPDKKVPLDVKIVEGVQQEGITRLTVSYVAEDEDRVTAYLYLPNSKDIKKQERRPAILALHPTGPLGKGIVAGLGPKENRAYGIELAQRGYVVLAPDYPSFGDLKDYDFEADRYVSGTMKAIVNHMRGVDLLVSRPDVDSDRIGVIGHSLGGHNAMFVGAFDPRLKVIVSSCGWCPFHDYYGGKITGWTSNRYMPRLKDVYDLDPNRVPFDFYELVAALAPRAFFSCSPLHDSNFDVAGVKKAIPVAAEVYKLLGAADNLQVRYPDCNHDFPKEMREEAYGFIDKHLEVAK